MPKPAVVVNACGKMLRRSLPALVGLGIVSAIGGTAWAGYRFVTTSPRFEIATIEVHGNQHVAADQIRAMLPVAIGDNVFAAKIDSLTSELHTNPWIAKSSAHRVLPHTIVIDVVEHEAVAIADLGGLYLVDRGGHPFKRAQLDTDEGAGLPIVTGLDRAAFLADPASTATTIQMGLDALAQWSTNTTRPKIGEVHVDLHGALTLHTYEHATAIQLGVIDAALIARMHTFDIAWAQLDDSERERARAIHLDPRLDHVTVAFEQKAAQ
ncbi:MAG TPA: FtsQ-type POTRA domain-containing protein [Kofleriaceae bacterium]